MVIKVKYNGEWVKIPYLSSDHGRELVEEAPKDGSQYARQNGIWSVVNIPDLEERYAYGVEWDTASSSPDGVRVGNMQLHRELPIQRENYLSRVR